MLLSAAIAPSVANAAPAYEGQNLIVNGDFETGAMAPWSAFGSDIDVAAPGSAWISSNQSAKNTVGEYGCYIQTHHTKNLVDGYIQQKFQIEAGTYEYGFDCSVRPKEGGEIYGGVPFYVYLVYYPNGADDESGAEAILLKEVDTPNNGNSNNLGYPFVHVGDIIEVETTGCYAFRILQKKLSDYPELAQDHSYGNTYDNISFKCLAPYEYPAGNLVKNGTFDAGNAKSGSVKNGATIPFWTVTNPAQTGKTYPGEIEARYGSWVVSGIKDENGIAADIGRYALFYQRNETETHYISQDITVPETGIYYISLKYTDRGNDDRSYPGFPFSFEIVSGGTAKTVLEVTSIWDDSKLYSLAKYETLQAGECTVRIKVPAYPNSRSTGVSFDDVIIMKVGAYTAEWTGNGVANDLADPGNWLCKDADGVQMQGATPDAYTETIYFKGTFAVDVPATAALPGKAVVFSDNAKLSRDCDWRGVSQTLSGTLDLCGNSLTISAMNGTAEFTDTSADASAPGELHLDFASGTLTNSGIALSGNLKFVKEGGGTFVSARQQSYSGGTLVAGGVAQLPDGSGSNANYSGYRFKAFSNGPITVSEGGAFDIRGNYDYNNGDGRALAINLDGGTFRNTGNSMIQAGWGRSGVGNVTKDSYAYVNAQWASNSKQTMFGGSRIELNGNRLTLRIENGNTFHIKSCIVANGTFAVAGASASSIGWFAPDGDLDMSTAAFDVSCIISLGSNTVDVKDYIVNYVGKSSEKDSAGTGPLNVHGSFKPNTDYFYGCTMLDGSTIDLSSRTTALPAATAFTRDASSLRREISYAGGTVAVIPPASVGGKTMRELSKSRDASGAYNGYIMYWNAQPAGVTFKLGGDGVSGCVLRASSAGLLLRPSPGMAVVVR